MPKAPPMKQRHYNEIVRGLNIAMSECRKVTETEEAAAAMLKDFIDHYFSVWTAVTNGE